jgi:hypothetical protein
VSQAEFQAGPWSALPAVTGWKAEPAGATLTLADGRMVTLGFVSPNVVRWWVPSAAGDPALAPAARYPADPGTVVKAKEADGILSLDSPGLGLKLQLSNLAWVLVRGDKVLLRTSGGPRVHGRRVLQAFAASDAARWTGPGIDADHPEAKFWVDQVPNAEATGPFATPVLFGAGGTAPLLLNLDNSYQTYTRVTADEASLGALNGGLDLLVATGAQAAGALEALTALTGRPPVPPTWAHGTAVDLPAAETGAFLRKAKVSVQTAAGPYRADRPRFQALVPATGTPDAWPASLATGPAPGAGVTLPPVAGRTDWNARFDDGGLAAPLARMNNRLPALGALALSQAWQSQNPGLRPLVLTASGGLGSVRAASPEIRVIAGADDGKLAQVLALGTAGQGTPAVHLDLTPLALPATRAAAWNSLLGWLLAPVLTLDWGPDPAGFWASLGEADQKRLKAVLDRRSQFKPLFAQLARQTAATGRPAWTPLWFQTPSVPQALACDDEYLVGEGLLVAPVPGGAGTRSVYLPGPGVWFDFWSGEEFGGGKSYDLDARADKPLLFARGGAFVPLREPEAFDEKDVYNPLTVHVFPGGRGTGTYWIDDGRTVAWKGGAYWETRLTYDFGVKDMTLEHEMVNNPGAWKADPYLLYRLHNVYKPRSVTIDTKPIPLYGDSWGITDTDRSAAWYENDHTLLIKTFRPEKDQTIQMVF